MTVSHRLGHKELLEMRGNVGLFVKDIRISQNLYNFSIHTGQYKETGNITIFTHTHLLYSCVQICIGH